MIKYDILIPAYNAQDSLPQLIKQLNSLELKPDKIYVIDDGSTDGTNTIADDLGCKVKSYAENKGKGFALKTGFNEFLQSSDSEFLICMDADLQHPAASIPDFLNLGQKEGSKFVIGNRRKSGGKMPVARIISNTLTSFILSIISRQKIKDSQCGYRLIHRDVLKLIKLKENGFQLESEFIIQAARKKVKIDFIDIPTIYNHENSHINHIGDTFRFIGLIIRELLHLK